MIQQLKVTESQYFPMVPLKVDGLAVDLHGLSSIKQSLIGIL
jgi:hypothetical protein